MDLRTDTPDLHQRPVPTDPRVRRGIHRRDPEQSGWKLDAWQRGLPWALTPEAKVPWIVAVGGGKGGVGKSLISANLSVQLAMMGRRVLALDLDFGGANLHTYFGMPIPSRTVADMIIYDRHNLRQILNPTPITNLWLGAGCREEIWQGAGEIHPKRLQQLGREILGAAESCQADYVVLDLGAGSQGPTVDFFTMAHLGLTTVLPEPTSVENAYIFLKSVLLRLIDHVGGQRREEVLAHRLREFLLNGDGRAGASARPNTYAERLAAAARHVPEFVADLHQALLGRVVGLTVNQIRAHKEVEIGRSMQLILQRFSVCRENFAAISPTTKRLGSLCGTGVCWWLISLIQYWQNALARFRKTW